MSASEKLTGQTAHVSFRALLLETLASYRLHGLRLTAPLLFPVLQLVLGLYIAFVVNVAYTYYFTVLHPEETARHPYRWGGLLALLMLALVWVHLRGFLRYTVLWTSLSLDAWTLLQGWSPDFSANYSMIADTRRKAYAAFLSVYWLPLFMAFLIAMGGLLPGIIFSAGPLLALTLVLQGLIVLFLGLFALLFQLVMSMGYQVIALEPVENPAQPWDCRPVLWRAWTLFRRAAWQVTALQILLFIVVNNVFPALAVGLLRLVRLTAPLDVLNLSLLKMIATPDFREGFAQLPLAGFWGALDTLMPQWAVLLTDSLLSLTLTLLLLPVGTLAFTLLYRTLTESEPPIGPAFSNRCPEL